ARAGAAGGGDASAGVGAGAAGANGGDARAGGGSAAASGRFARAGGGSASASGAETSAFDGAAGTGVGSAGGGHASAGGLGGDGRLDAELALEVEAAAAVPRDGVWGVDGRPTALTALTGRGVQVDGIRARLSDLEALAELRLPAPETARLATDPALEAWAALEHDALPRTGGETHVTVRLRGNPRAEAPRGLLRVHLVIDRSSSMQRSWDRVLASARMLIQRLHPDDTLQIVAYGTDAVEAWPAARVGDGRAAMDALDEITVGGGTNIEAGLRMAYGAARHADPEARGLVLLLSDGVPNHGAFEATVLGELAAGARAACGTTTSVIGLGTEFDARMLRRIARDGRGGYHVSASVEELAAGLVAELEAHSRAAARRLSVRVELDRGVELLDVADGEAGAEQVDGGVRLTLPSLDAGEERRLVLRVRVPGHRRARAVGRVAVTYRSGRTGRAVTASKELSVSMGATRRAADAAGAAVIDADLAAALDEAGAAIRDGDATAAVGALEAHADLAAGRIEHRRSARLRARVRVVRRVARAVGELLPEASHPQRRQVSLAFGGLAVRLQR
ncbi:MAG TPA: VWA domain-containing protein, partial [Sandaracinaceae bacterium LLY-WYZ-13_1]|nr:VWA domain-containing protein [Sandaracinaceae bacterium LLY-WYZ-13_1]